MGTKLRDGYAPLLDSEGAPRISVDEPREHLGDEAV